MMGYQVTITRGDENSEDGQISKNEWLDYVASDSELEVDEGEGDFPTVTWTRGPITTQFMWEDVGVWSWSPENTTVEKMIEIAEKLNANVIGEDGTVFMQDDGEFIETYHEGQMPDDNADTRPWWKKLFSNK